MIDVAETIARINAGRDPERLAMKYKAMRTSPFVFLRGTCHLFYERLPQAGVLDDAPPVWICGDMHLENFGSYKADNGLVYFDNNDFDEACLAPNLAELARLLTSVLAGAADLKLSRAQALALCHTAVEAYGAALAFGKARWVERETSSGMVRDLFDALASRTRAAHLDRRTTLKGKTRTLKVDGKKALPVSDERRAAVTQFMQQFAAGESDPDFYRVLDVARRIAGTGSLGVDRYVILVEGKGSPDGNYLLDLKEALPSSVAPHVRTPQPAWRTEAERVVEIQRRNQAVSQAFLHAVDFNQRSYVLRSLQPSEDRVALQDWDGKLPRLEAVVGSMAELSAWAHLRSGGRQKSSIADEMIAFGNRADWHSPLIELATQCAAQVAADWKTYCDAYDRGAFAV
ncbi:DUF2252 domain-containing protein [Paraburkholderia phenoliruptrix]|uniref:DUF2252 domain-containing protein n=2 Tax=Paraburkholderia phenoliruptrix TaxID=252970 RepID=K0DT20_9BURK|nr:DUF2252 domain-containing protein [Paraburkholderia phenoliruptrix]AFT89301.1 hypothetical protein BUPH_05785 [Paraburkholderia phenoliruptrix BR3459a]MDR6422044.1 uncharacterized protein (DUF2252 family) [Paraburkholderia phenoliruptrix]CAB4050758.1 hypothetical protein LMG9964_04425 [Paraburkholderia phenoliruptrix]